MEEKKPISHTSFWGGPDGRVFLGSARITTVRREGTKVFVRTLRSDEDPETADPPMEGDHLVFEPGAISIGGAGTGQNPPLRDVAAMLRYRVLSGGAMVSC